MTLFKEFNNREQKAFEYITEQEYSDLKEDAYESLQNHVYTLAVYNKRLVYLDYCLQKSKEKDEKNVG